MRRFLNKLMSNFRTTNTARTARRVPRSTSLRVEGLEDRVVLSSASQVNSTLNVGNMAQNHQVLIRELQSNGIREMQILDNGVPISGGNLFNVSTIKAVNIQVAGGDSVIVDDSGGMPFDQGSTITLFGSGTNSSLTLQGSRAVSGNETYVAGGLSFTPGVVFLDNMTFQFNTAIASVSDKIQITGTDDVQTSGTNVLLSGSNGTTQTLSGMGFGGGDVLTYANKPSVVVEDFAVNANVFLNASASSALENAFGVTLHGAGDSTTIATTPHNVFTKVHTDFGPVPNQTTVFLRANAGTVEVLGTSSTQMIVGQPQSNGTFSTKGIQGNVIVANVGFLFMSDSGNVSTAENVKVTESNINGTGLFGNNSVNLSYFNVGTVSLVSGQKADQYTVIGSHLEAKFTSRIDITDFSSGLFRTDVTVDSGSHLNLSMLSDVLQPGQLFVHHGTGTATVHSNPGTADGEVDVTFGGVLTGQIAYHNYLVQA